MRAQGPRVGGGPRAPVGITPKVAMAAIATTAAATRQKVSLRRILRRSTITSESSDIEFLLKYPARFAFAASPKPYPITSIAMQYEESKAHFPSPLVGEGGSRRLPDEGSLSAETNPPVTNALSASVPPSPTIFRPGTSRENAK